MSKEIYKQIGEAISIERDYAHVNTELLNELRGDGFSRELITKDEAVKLFNETAELMGAKALFNPTGYMVLDDNLRSYIYETFEDKYNQALEDVEAGGLGTVHAVDAVLTKVEAAVERGHRYDFVRKELKDFLPKDIDLRFVRATDERKDIVNKLVDARVAITRKHSIRRSVDDSSLQGSIDRYKQLGEMLKVAIIHDDLAMDKTSGLQI